MITWLRRLFSLPASATTTAAVTTEHDIVYIVINVS